MARSGPMYGTIAEVKAMLDIQSTTYDTQLTNAGNAVADKIDEYCGGRRFYTATETRYFHADVDEQHINPFSERRFGSLWRLDIDDVVSISQVQVDMNGDRLYEVTLDPTKDYYLLPVNAPLMSPPRPFTFMAVDFINGQGWYFPPWPKAVAITGEFGFGAIYPDEVHEAWLLQVIHLFKRREAPFGVLGGEDFAYPIKLTTPLDPDVKFLLRDLMRISEAVLFV